MDKLTAELMRKMIAFSEGNLHDINHFLKVYAYARTIAVGEGVPDDVRTTVEIAAIVHDIACPLCRVKYGNTNGKKQEEEEIGLTRTFLSDSGLSEAMRERIVYLVGHHHTPAGADGPDYQILLEADYLSGRRRGGRFWKPATQRRATPDASVRGKKEPAVRIGERPVPGRGEVLPACLRVAFYARALPSS